MNELRLLHKFDEYGAVGGGNRSQPEIRSLDSVLSDHDQSDQLPVVSTTAAIKAFVTAWAAMASMISPRR